MPKPPTLPRQFGTQLERLAGLEVSIDHVREDLSDFKNDVKEDFTEQNLKLDDIQDKVDNVQSSFSTMREDIMKSVHNLLVVAKNTKNLDDDLAGVAKAFSKERVATLVKVGSAIATGGAVLWGFLQYFIKGNLFQ